MSEQETIPQEKLKEVNTLLDKAKLQLIAIKKSVFTTTLLFNLKFNWSLKIPTADTDGLGLRINPDFFTQLTPPERVFLLAHEAWHVAFDHVNRFNELPQPEEERNFDLYNQAADHVINLMLKDKGYSVPTFACCNRDFTNMSTEEVYYKLLKDKSKTQLDFKQDFTANNPNPSTPEEKERQQKIQQNVNDVLVKANTASNMEAGKDGAEDVPECIKGRIEELINPKVDWRTLLRNFMFEIRRDDYSYRRPNRKYMPHIILPSLYSEGMGKLTIGIDVSGSVGDDEFNAFMSEITQIKDALQPQTIELIQWHHDIASVDIIDQYQDLSGVEFNETGGTRIAPLMELALQDPPEIMIIFTDGYFSPYKHPENINFPVIWLIYDNDSFTTQYGQVIEYDPET